MKKHWPLFAFPALLLLTPLLLAVWYMVNFQYSWDQAWIAVGSFGQSRTRYAQQFSEANFSRVTAGMRGDAVYKLIGNPLEGHIIDGKPAPLWKYSLPRDGARHFHERAVLFDIQPGKPPVVRSVIRRPFQPEDD